MGGDIFVGGVSTPLHTVGIAHEGSYPNAKTERSTKKTLFPQVIHKKYKESIYSKRWSTVEVNTDVYSFFITLFTLFINKLEKAISTKIVSMTKYFFDSFHVFIIFWVKTSLSVLTWYLSYFGLWHRCHNYFHLLKV